MSRCVAQFALFIAAALGGVDRTALAGETVLDTRDVIIILDEGPLRLRIHLRLDGRPLSEGRDAYLQRLITTLDTDENGRLSQAERKQSPLFTAGRKTFDNEFLASLEKNRTVTRADLENDLARFGAGQSIGYRQDKSAAENDLKVFDILDADGSGRVEPVEMRTAVARIAALDGDRDEVVDFAEFSPPPAQPDVPELVIPGMQADDGPKPTFSTLLRDFQDRLLPQRIVRSYDRDRDGRLTLDELGWDASRASAVDVNGDGHINAAELAQIDNWPMDLELTVNLSSEPNAASPALVVNETASDHRVPTPRLDLIRLHFGDTTVTFSHRQFDPVSQALESAMRVFNDIDQDTNGYLDREEIVDRFRFERYLFAAMDTDDDDKVFAEEMRAYVAVVCEPASLTCHVNVYDTGQGFFQLLDNSGDGRISIRELRMIEASLIAAAGAAGQPLLPQRIGRHYHVEFTRGAYQLFGRTQQMIAQGSQFISRPAAGPAWFQGMDRNRDGDLTYDSIGPYGGEFLGPREDFDRLDADADGLISIKEAEFAEKLFRRE